MQESFYLPEIQDSPSNLSLYQRENMVRQIITRVPCNLPTKNLQKSSQDPLCIIPSHSISLDDALAYIPNKTNRILLQIAWDKLPFFREHYNLLLTDSATFIRKCSGPNGIIVYMHCDKTKNSCSLSGYLLIENPFVQEIKMFTSQCNKFTNFLYVEYKLRYIEKYLHWLYK